MTLSRRLFIAAVATTAAAAQPARRPAAPFARTAEAAGRFEQMHALVIARDGEIVRAEAFRGPPVERAVNVKSVSKTIVAALLGAAVDRGEVGVDATLGALIPGLIPAEADPRVRAITLEDLVTLRAGLEATSGPRYGAWVSSRDWVGYALARPLVAEPGGRMIYSTGSSHVLGAALAEATGESLLAQARARLGEPLGIEIAPWSRDPQGYYLGGNEMALSPLALVRFGEMVRTGGTGADGAVLSRDWVDASLRPRTRSPFSGLDYGYGWFLGRAGGRRFALARGYGGQVLAIFPELAVTVAITSDPTQPARSEGYFGALMDLIGDTLVPEAA